MLCIFSLTNTEFTLCLHISLYYFIILRANKEVVNLLELVNIDKQFVQKVVLENIDLKINTGEIVSLLGPSGSGKSTLLNIILGLTKENQGKVIFNNTDLSNIS